MVAVREAAPEMGEQEYCSVVAGAVRESHASVRSDTTDRRWRHFRGSERLGS